MDKKVLIVDDEEGLFEMFGRYFTQMGYAPTMAKNGREALAALENTPDFDLVVLDLNMPEMNGEELMEKMAGHPAWKKIPIAIDSVSGVEGQWAQRLRERFAGRLHFGFFERVKSTEELEEAIHQIMIL